MKCLNVSILAFLLFSSAVLLRAEDETVVEEEVVSKKANTIGASPDVKTTYLITSPVDAQVTKEIPVGKGGQMTVGFQNKGEKDFHVLYCQASFRHPQDFKQSYQNFTTEKYETVVRSKEDSSFDVTIVPNDNFAGNALILSIDIFYHDSNKVQYKSNVFNATVFVVHDTDGFSFQNFSLFLTLAAVIGGGGYLVYNYMGNNGERRSTQRVPVEVAPISEEVDYEWIPQEVLKKQGNTSTPNTPKTPKTPKSGKKASPTTEAPAKEEKKGKKAAAKRAD
uniref:Translocon-associated protein subunit alpha n=1 Tax=Rhabditophanes sp. KR3021 TaxID=114890 RepID=A0AC35TIF8_9BILA